MEGIWDQLEGFYFKPDFNGNLEPTLEEQFCVCEKYVEEGNSINNDGLIELV
jgi:hypothetical protein